MRPKDVRKVVDWALVQHTFNLTKGAEYCDQMNPYTFDGDPIRFERFKRHYVKLTEA